MMTLDGTVHVACAEVAALGRETPAPGRWFTPSEQERLALLVTDKRRSQFTAARWQARWLLAQVLGGTPRDWLLEAPHDAPPQVTGRADLHLSISHSGDYAACALSAEPVGIDLEQPRARRDIAGLVSLCCTPGEQALFDGAPTQQRDALFHELWTVKEAWLKRRGEWIAPKRLQQLDAGLAADGEIRAWSGGAWRLAVTAKDLKWWSTEPVHGRAWRVTDLS
jgi:4'-phosphopantetheinyl transferase